MTTALLPVFGLILLGMLLSRMQFPGDSFWPQAEKLTYYLLFPALLVGKLATAETGAVDIGRVATLVVGFLLAGSLLLWLLQRLVGWNGPRFTSIYQGGIRFNTYVGLATVSQLLGDGAMAVAAVAIALMIPLINLLCIAAFALYAGAERPSPLRVARQILSNPLIMACVTGIAWNLLGLPWPDALGLFMELLGQTALPMGLLAVGAGLQLSALRGASAALVWSSAVKLLGLPLLVLLLCQLTGTVGVTREVLLILAVLPTASSAYILARQLGGDAPLMAALISAQTLLAMLSMPLLLGLLL
ncbi:AEC family transporter [Aestuariirhabdus litorea]|uniref:AEC family transporter n=1 Tax=Aestuariirhabdus litorea TaxID=2528527 RepID=A0A3P3VLM1_9GAMM|nr:AEC family transporter [Aestuariirhabdus litorea]RRJ83227.1 AEC family transporter [Aestuariirhabdus litorea]RWW93384.1 AEC family transporter [Endozoicomonadaceae bacterium GTF-13]